MSKKPKRINEAQVSKINELHASGMNAYQIAKNLGIPPGVAKYHIDRNRLATLAPSSQNAPLITTSAPTPRSNNANQDRYKQELDNVYLQEISKLKQKNKLLAEVIAQL